MMMQDLISNLTLLAMHENYCIALSSVTDGQAFLKVLDPQDNMIQSVKLILDTLPAPFYNRSNMVIIDCLVTDSGHAIGLPVVCSCDPVVIWRILKR